jgi:hypothetical protein
VTLTVSWDRPAGRHPGRMRAGFAALKSAVTAAGKAAVRPHKASLRRLADMPLTVLGTGGIDFAGFHVTHGLGWLITGVSLVIIEHLIADPE